MTGVIHRLAHRLDIGFHAGRSFVLGGKHRLDPMFLVGGQLLGIFLDRNALTPFNLAQVYVQPQPFRHVDPESENCPKRDINTRSPAFSVLVMAVSHMPVPEDG